MKKIIFFVATLSLFSANSFAKTADGFFFRPSISIEYSAPSLSNSGSKNFHSNNLGKQISGFENIALGGNFRVHKFLGFNANWVQGALSDNSLQNVGYLNNKARFKFDQYNFSALAYLPVNEFVEFFAEAGVSDIHSRLNYLQNSGVVANQKSHQTKTIYGLGFQFKPCEKSEDVIRVSFQKYSGKLELLDANYATVRIGYLKAF